MMTERQAAIIALLEIEDHDDVRRQHHRTLDGKPEEQARILRTQPVVYVQYQQLAKEVG